MQNNENKHPFRIRCGNCGSNDVNVVTRNSNVFNIKCNVCGRKLNCEGYVMNPNITTYIKKELK